MTQLWNKIVKSLTDKPKSPTPLTQLGLSSRVLICLGREGIIYDDLPTWILDRRPKTLKTVEDILEFTRLLTLMRQRRNLLVNRNDSQMAALHYVRGFGPKRREELENKLYEYGFIDSPDTKVPRPTTWTNMEADSDRVNNLFNAHELRYMGLKSPYDFADPSNELRSHTPRRILQRKRKHTTIMDVEEIG